MPRSPRRVTLPRAALAVALVTTAGGRIAAQDDDFDRRVAGCLLRARQPLLGHLENASGGELLLTVLAAIHDEVPRDGPEFARAIERATDLDVEGTYELALRLMIASEAPWLEGREALARQDLKLLMRNLVGDKRSAGFTYPMLRTSENWDLSNTQYGVLGLRAAAAMGLEVKQQVWTALAQSMLGHQARDGGFGYQPAAREFAYPSMTVAGIAVLQVCRMQLFEAENEPRRRGTDLRVKLERALDRAWSWMEGHRDEIGSESARSCLYFHYGLERAAILSEVAEVRGVDWYRAGAEMLMELQQTHGGWAHDAMSKALLATADKGIGSAVDTSFAILFLRRKFQRQIGPVTGAKQKGILGLTAQATDEEIRAAAKLEVARGSAGMADVITAMASELRAQRVAAVYALHGLCGEDFRFNPHRGAEHNEAAIAAARAWLADNPYK